jgi:molecular chaperone DnaK
MKKEAELHAEEDKKKRELIDLRNNAESVIFQTEKVLKESGDKVPEDVKKEVNEKIEALKKVKDGTDAAAIKKAFDDINQTVQKIGQAMYQQQSQTPPENDQAQSRSQTTKQSSSAGSEQGPVEAEYEEVKEDKNSK